jgi:hypothetical protein
MIKRLRPKKATRPAAAKHAAVRKDKASPAQTGPQEKTKMSPEPTTAKSSSAAAPAPAERAAPTIRYLDRADMEETFADSISGLIFDGQTLRIEFAVTRFDEVKANTPITGRRYPACRLVLPPAAAVDLINRMQQIATALTQAGVVKAAPPRAAAETPKAG